MQFCVDSRSLTEVSEEIKPSKKAARTRLLVERGHITSLKNLEEGETGTDGYTQTHGQEGDLIRLRLLFQNKMTKKYNSV
jgi:hypothetical protein